MSRSFVTEPVALWEYHAAYTTTKHPHTPNSSQYVTAINGTEPSWEPEAVPLCHGTTQILIMILTIFYILLYYSVILSLEAPNFCLYVGHLCEFCDETLCTHTLNYAL